MCSKSLISVLILYLCFDYAHQHKENHMSRLYRQLAARLPAANDWDFLMFTQQWPSSMCKVWTHKKPHHHCVFPKKPDSWTIHGIWPTKKGTKGPFNCNNTWLFDVEQIRPIENELEEAWTNIEKETALYNLWAHEWNKHGTCAASLEALNSQLKYFSKGIELLNKYHMNDMLSAANILPSNTTGLNAQDINKAIASKLGIRPFIACEFEDGIQYLMELRICFDKQMNVMECEGEHEINGLITNCVISKEIMYPAREQPANRQLVQLYKFVNWVQWFTL
ncbi:ribonuclease Oy-like [Helicoverpa zea]|uniref:ribonuclease Oy-like n=1 Tax=Helicoverpa zea TaxID=7113 RepID=UPI001F5965FE|nr:ribonuclease Oy-like [Helicoverpa zea]